MYFPDLSHCDHEFLPDCYRWESWENYDSPKPSLYVGWLDLEHPYPQGEVSAEVVATLGEIRREVEIFTKGRHSCEFCVPGDGHSAVFQGMALGGCDIHVIGDHAVYYAPDLIIHYITAHNYRPPQEFIDAVLFTAALRKEIRPKSTRLGFTPDDGSQDNWRWPVAEIPDEQGRVETVYIFRKEGLARIVQKMMHVRGYQSEVGPMNLEAWVEGHVDLKMGEWRSTGPWDVFPRLQSAYYLQSFAPIDEIIYCNMVASVFLSEMPDWAYHIAGISLSIFRDVPLEPLQEDHSEFNFENPENFILMRDEIADPQATSSYLVFQKGTARLVPEDENHPEIVASLVYRNAEVFQISLNHRHP